MAQRESVVIIKSVLYWGGLGFLFFSEMVGISCVVTFRFDILLLGYIKNIYLNKILLNKLWIRQH